MIESFKHKGLKAFFTTGSKAGIQAVHSERLRLILGRLNIARESCDMDLPGFDLHPLQPKNKKYWSVTVNKNWRITFKFTGKNVVDVDLLDYH